MIDVVIAHHPLRPGALLHECLAALQVATDRPRQVDVVVQGHPGGVDLAGLPMGPWDGMTVAWHFNDENTGPVEPRASLQPGSRSSVRPTPEYWVGLDDDIMLPRGGLDAMIELAEAPELHGTVGAVAMDVYLPGRHESGLQHGTFWMDGEALRIERKASEGTVETEQAKGLVTNYSGLGCCLVPAASFERAQFDGELFVDGDRDFCYQLHLASLKVVLCTEPRALHKALGNEPGAEYMSIRYDEERVRASYAHFNDKWGFRHSDPG